MAVESTISYDNDEIRAAIKEVEVSLLRQDLKQKPVLIVIVDNSDFISKEFNNFLWVTFTRSNPAADIFGAGEFIKNKHWGCTGPLIIDARIKVHHAPVLGK